MAARKDVGLMAPYGAQTKILAEPPQARLTNEESRRARASLNQSLPIRGSTGWIQAGDLPQHAQSAI